MTCKIIDIRNKLIGKIVADNLKKECGYCDSLIQQEIDSRQETIADKVRNIATSVNNINKLMKEIKEKNKDIL